MTFAEIRDLAAEHGIECEKVEHFPALLPPDYAQPLFADVVPLPSARGRAGTHDAAAVVQHGKTDTGGPQRPPGD
jgi:hypothetical protein